MNKETKAHLHKILKRLEESSQQIQSTRGYLGDAAKVKLLQELIKEQVQDENPSRSTRPVR
jgi:hypothetical protein